MPTGSLRVDDVPTLSDAQEPSTVAGTLKALRRYAEICSGNSIKGVVAEGRVQLRRRPIRALGCGNGHGATVRRGCEWRG